VSALSLAEFAGSSDAFAVVKNITNSSQYPIADANNNIPYVPYVLYRNTKMFHKQIQNCSILNVFISSSPFRFYNQCQYDSDREINYGDAFTMRGFVQWPKRFVYTGYMVKVNQAQGFHFWYVLHLYSQCFNLILFIYFLVMIICSNLFTNYIYQISAMRKLQQLQMSF